MEGTTRFVICRSSATVGGAEFWAGSGRGGGGVIRGFEPETDGGAVVATLTNSGVETLSLGSSAGAQLHPKIVQPPFSA
jgi:hypothetical protein